MNKVELLGRLTKDVDLRYSQGAQAMAIARFTVAINRRVAADRQQAADFISCIAFGKTAENIDKYFHKGNLIAVVGRIQTGSYTNKDGQKVYTTDVVIEDLEFAESKAASENRGGGSYGGSRSNGHSSEASGAVGEGFEGFMNIPEGIEDEGLPFN